MRVDCVCSVCWLRVRGIVRERELDERRRESNDDESGLITIVRIGTEERRGETKSMSCVIDARATKMKCIE